MKQNSEEQLKMEHKITEYIKNDNDCCVSFAYYQENCNIWVNVVTFNFSAKTKLHTEIGKGITYHDALIDVLKKIESTRRTQSYSVKWSDQGKAMETSYFYAKDVNELLAMFYSSKGDTSKTIVYEIKLNPES